MHAKRKLEQRIRERVRERFDVELERVVFSTPPRLDLGDLGLALPFELAKSLRRPPPQIAAQLAADLQGEPLLSKVEAVGGYVNLFLRRGLVLRGLLPPAAADPAPAGGKVVVEHTNINPNKAAHVGHLRNAALGDSLVRVLRFLGYPVEVQDYIDDTGVQVADVVLGLMDFEGRGTEDLDQLPGRFDFYCWDLYARVTRAYEERPELAQRRAEILRAIEHGAGPEAELAAAVAGRIVDCHLATMARLGVRYDLLTWESDILGLRFWQQAFELLKESGAIERASSGKNAGCWVMAVPEVDAGREKVIVRSDGTATYVAKDIAYQLWKFGLLKRDFHYRLYAESDGHRLWSTTRDPARAAREAPTFGRAQRVINTIDVRQSYLQQVVVGGLRRMGYLEEAERSTHFAYEMVALSPSCARALGFELQPDELSKPYVEISGRKGQGVKADDLIDRLLEKARAKVEENFARSGRAAEPDKLQQTAQAVAIGALRYYLVKFGRNKVIAFDFDEALAFEGETGPYLMYALVRMRSIFTKLREHGILGPGGLEALQAELAPEALEAGLQEEATWDMVRFAAELEQTAVQTVEDLELSHLAKWCFVLAQKFSNFYHRCPILQEPDPARRAVRALATWSVARQLEIALGLLGVRVPERM